MKVDAPGVRVVVRTLWGRVAPAIGPHERLDLDVEVDACTDAWLVRVRRYRTDLVGREGARHYRTAMVLLDGATLARNGRINPSAAIDYAERQLRYLAILIRRHTTPPKGWRLFGRRAS